MRIPLVSPAVEYVTPTCVKNYFKDKPLEKAAILALRVTSVALGVLLAAAAVLCLIGGISSGQYIVALASLPLACASVAMFAATVNPTIGLDVASLSLSTAGILFSLNESDRGRSDNRGHAPLNIPSFSRNRRSRVGSRH